MLPARASFKLTSEVALMIVYLLQCYPKRLQQYAAALLPLMVQVGGGWWVVRLHCPAGHVCPGDAGTALACIWGQS